MRDSPCEDVLDSLATAPEKVLDGSKYIKIVGESQEEGMMSTAASFPSVMKPRFIEPVGARKHLQGVVSNLESCTTQPQNFSPNLQ